MAAPAAAPGWRAVARREWQRLHADRWDWWMLTWIPLLAYALTAWIFSAGTPRELPIALVDQDHTSISRQLTRMLEESPGITVLPVAQPAEAMRLLRERRAWGLVLVPPGLQQDLLAGRAAQVQWLYNGQFQAHAGNLSRDVRTVVSTLSAGVELTAREKRGAAPQAARAGFEPIQLQLVTLFNEHTSYEAFLTLAVLPTLLQIFVAVAAAVAIGRELRAGTVPQWLQTAGGSWAAALTGKLLIPAICFTLQGWLFVAFFGGVRGWTVEGSGPTILAGQLLLVLAYLAVGALLVAITLSLRNALSLSAFYTAPALAFAGQGFPLLAMPALAKTWAMALPLTHYLQLQTRHWLVGAPWTYGLRDLAILAGFALGFGLLAALLLRSRALDPDAWGRL